MSSNVPAETDRRSLPALMKSESTEARVAEVLPAGMDVKRVMRLANLAIYKEPKIASCDPMSVIQCLVDASSLGLEIDSPIGGAHLVPFGKTCTMIIDYRGLIRLALRSGFVDKIIARVVLEGEDFQLMQGTTEGIHHIPFLDGEDAAMRGVYATAKLSNGETVFVYMSKKEVDAIKNRSRAGDSGPWNTDYEAMAKKTAVKQLTKWLDLNPEFSRAIEFDNRGEGFSGGTIEDDDRLSITKHLAEQAEKTKDELKAKLGLDGEDDEAPADE